MEIIKKEFGKLPHNQTVDLYVLSNGNGLEARVMTYGATLVSLSAPDQFGRRTDITLGYDSLEGYLSDTFYLGATIGRYANRIAKSRFSLEGIEYNLTVNDGENHLHGGKKGFHKVLWQAEPVSMRDEIGVRLLHLSKDGDEGYPGNLWCEVTYALTRDNTLKISYEAHTDKRTHVNLANHSYFNLAGQGSGDVLGHELMLSADGYTTVDAGLIPTGEIRGVLNSPMDFMKPHMIGERIGKVQGGYDHNFVLRGEGGLVLAAKVSAPQNGIAMEIYTTEPGIQFYSGNFLDGSITGKNGKIYEKYSGLCLEPQHFPDSPNRPQFPSTVLIPGDRFKSLSAYKIYIDNHLQAPYTGSG
jgi:aldose 1-epimerase